MTGRAATIQGGLAALGLLTAYFTWQRDIDLAPGAVTVVDASRSDLARLHYEDDNNKLDIYRGGNAKDIRVRLEEKAKTPPKPPANAADKTPPAPPAPPPPRELLGSDAALSLFEKFAPLISPRAFGTLDATKLKELGLDPPKRKLTVTVKGIDREFEIGQPANASSGESFLRDKRDGKVYLMPRGVTPELQNGMHMIDRKMHTFDTTDYDRLVIIVGDKRKEFVHNDKASISTEWFAAAKTPDKRDQMAKNWHDTLFRLFPMEMLGEGETPSEGAPKTALRVEYYDGKKQIAWIEIAKGPPPPAAATTTLSESAPPAANDPAPNYYARSEHTLGWAKLHAGNQQLVSDAEKLAAN